MSQYPSIDPLHLRATAGKFATGISVVAIKEEDDAVRGMTANSFLSVSLDPPLVLFSVQNEATLKHLLKVDVRVGISILEASQQHISRHFAGQELAPRPPNFVEQEGAPVLEQNLAWFATQIESIIPAGDHVLVICKVQSCNSHTGNPLIYFSGYRELASARD